MDFIACPSSDFRKLFSLIWPRKKGSFFASLLTVWFPSVPSNVCCYLKIPEDLNSRLLFVKIAMCYFGWSLLILKYAPIYGHMFTRIYFPSVNERSLLQEIVCWFMRYASSRYAQFSLLLSSVLSLFVKFNFPTDYKPICSDVVASYNYEIPLCLSGDMNMNGEI